MSKPVVLITGVNPNRPNGNIAYNTVSRFLLGRNANVIAHCLREEDAQAVISDSWLGKVDLVVWGDLADPAVAESVANQINDWLSGRKLGGWIHTPGPFPKDPTSALTHKISVEMLRGNVDTFTVPFGVFSSMDLFALKARIVTFSVSTADDMTRRSGAIRAYGEAKKELEKACAKLQQSNDNLLITTLALGVVEGTEHTPPGFEDRYLVPMTDVTTILFHWILLEGWHLTGVQPVDRGWSSRDQ